MEGDAILLREVWTGVTLDRPQLAVARRLAAEGEVDALFAYSTDRFSRDPVDLLVLMREFAGRGVDVHFVQEPTDTSPEGELLFFVRGYAAGQEHAKIRERTVRGKIAAARAGRMPVGASSQPYGYDYDPMAKQRVVNQVEAKVVRRIFRLYSEGWSMFRIAQTLNEEGIPSKTGVEWSTTVIRLILSNKSYIGLDYYGKTKTVRTGRGRGKQVWAPRDEWIEIRGYTPPIIEERLFLKVQERLGEAQERYRGRKKHRYVLTGFLRCGKCGYAVVGAGYVDDKYWYYRCRAKSNDAGGKNKNKGKAKACDTRPRVPGAWAEDKVWSAVVEMVRDPSGVIADLELNARTGGGDIGKEIDGLRVEVQEVEREESRMLRLYRRGKVRIEVLESDMEELSRSLEKLRERLTALEKQREQEESAGLAGVRIREYCRKVSAGLDELDTDGRRALMSRLGIKVFVVKGDLMITAEIDSGFVSNEGTSA